MKGAIRFLRRVLSADAPPTPIDQLWRQQHHAIAQGFILVRASYLCLFFILLQNYPQWESWSRATSLRLLWPVMWFDWVGNRVGVPIVIFAALFTALAAAAVPGVRWVRAIAAVAILEFGAFFNSFGVINHGWHSWIWPAFIFILLPDGPFERVTESATRRQRYLRAVWAAQAANLLFYSLSGTFKLAGGIVQMSRGEFGSLSPHALARHIAYRLQEGPTPPGYNFGPFIVEHPYVGWPMFLTAIYLEFCSFPVAFRPKIHRVWGVALLLFHLGIFFTMTIMFSWQMLAIGLLMICSPFAPTRRMTIREVVRQLPILGDIIGWTLRLRDRRGRSPRSRGQAEPFVPRATAP